MRVLRLCADFAPVAVLTEALDDYGVQQIVLTARAPRTPATEPYGDLSCVVRVGAPVSATKHLYGPFSLTRLRALVRAVHVVHAHDIENLAVMQAASLAAAIGGVPLVVSIDEDAQRRGRRRALTRADALIVNSHATADELEADFIPSERLYVPPLDVDPAAWMYAVYQDVWSRTHFTENAVAIKARA